MSRMVERVKAYSNAYHKYRSIDNADELKKNGLQLVDWEILTELLRDLWLGDDNYKARCFIKPVADWCRKAGLKVVEPCENGVDYLISIL